MIYQLKGPGKRIDGGLPIGKVIKSQVSEIVPCLSEGRIIGYNTFIQ